MPKSKNNRKKKKVIINNCHKQHQFPPKTSLVEGSPNSEIVSKLIQQADAKKLFLFIQILIENAGIQFSSGEKEWFETFDKLLSTNTDFFMSFLFSIYFKEESSFYCEHITNSAEVITEHVAQDCSEKFKNEVLDYTHFPVGFLGKSEGEELRTRIQWYSTKKLNSILDLVKAIYTSIFLESIHNLIEVERKIAEF